MAHSRENGSELPSGYLDRSMLDAVLVSFVRQLPFFQRLSYEQQYAIAKEIYVQSFDAGQTLFHQGDSADAIYIIVSGEVAMSVEDDGNGGERLEEILTTYEPGTSFGERGVLGDLPRAAKAYVRRRILTLVLPTDRFKALLSRNSEIGFGLYRELVAELEAQSEKARQSAHDLNKMKDVMQATKMAALGQLVAGVAHEINTPVGSISSNADQLIEVLQETRELVSNSVQAPDDGVRQEIANNFQDLEEMSNQLGEAANRIRDQVQSLSNYARLDEAERKHANIHEGLDATLSLLRHELKYHLNVEKAYGLCREIDCYPNQLNQVFMNILMNAIQAFDFREFAAGEKGLIEIETKEEPPWATIVIRDTGRGIPADKLDKIFEPFYSTKGAGAAAGGLGLGLGLSISKKIIEEKHLGELEIESEEGQGTAFFIRLPLDTSLQGQSPRPSLEHETD